MPGALVIILAIQCSWLLPAGAIAQGAPSQPDTLVITPVSTSQSVRMLLQDVENIHYLRSTIRDEAGWEKFWDQMIGDHPKAPVRPTVDFSREMLILASDGVMKNYNTVGIAKVVDDRDSLVVYVLSRVNVSPGCYYDGAFSPISIVRVPKSELPARFVEDRIDEKCGYAMPVRPPNQGHGRP